ncbi:larval cuticle protein 65Ag1-like [Drosophila innubila]|uniref:larval cuticle protein 65Ag1-like n=1 Tax=Drosophila innubila TaxID=198719 RepID=UPI00148D2FA8|nr:larval cuticle protein 65Ag1-like [Drosophila innubila]
MKYTITIVFAAVLSVILAAPLDNSQTAHILHQSADVQPDGYNFDWETSDGQKHEEEGTLTNPGAENEAIAVHGSFSFTADDGLVYTVNYVADENGFQPQGAHLPTPNN